jgi:Tfp pilus assembly protein PilF
MGIDAFKHILDIDPHYVPAHFHLAGCYAATNQHKQSLKYYEFVRQNAPELASELAKIIQKHGGNPT